MRVLSRVEGVFIQKMGSGGNVREQEEKGKRKKGHLLGVGGGGGL